MVATLRALAEADATYEVLSNDSSGFGEMALAIDEHIAANRGGEHPNRRGNRARC